MISSFWFTFDMWMLTGRKPFPRIDFKDMMEPYETDIDWGDMDDGPGANHGR